MNESDVCVFNPGAMPVAVLESILVQRRAMVRRLLARLGASAETGSTHHLLFVGAAGMGKTHLVNLLAARVGRSRTLRKRFWVAHLDEQQGGVASLLDLLARIFATLRPALQRLELWSRVEGLYALPFEEAEEHALVIFETLTRRRMLLLFVEGLEDLFGDLGDHGQKRLRALLQQVPRSTIVATTPRLFHSIGSRDAPFYGFFNVHHLESLTEKEALRLVVHVAKLRGDRSLQRAVETPPGPARVRAVYDLAGGNHRFFALFARDLRPASLDALIEPVVRVVDTLRPQVETLLASLSSQQRRIVLHLAAAEGAMTVKEIARRSFATHQTASGQLKILRDKSIVTARAVGRESYYDVADRVVGLVSALGHASGEPLRHRVRLVRAWHARTEATLAPEDEALLATLAPAVRAYGRQTDERLLLRHPPEVRRIIRTLAAQAPGSKSPRDESIGAADSWV